jgi:hypothetical protein
MSPKAKMVLACMMKMNVERWTTGERGDLGRIGPHLYLLGVSILQMRCNLVALILVQMRGDSPGMAGHGGLREMYLLKEELGAVIL